MSFTTLYKNTYMLSCDLKDKDPGSQDAFKFSWSDPISDWNQNPFLWFFHQGLHTPVDRITQFL